ncbi:MAG: RagB/SusD family nutrient uptake outer membrane protein [Bacteroides sp.]|nr:RagB/SusD family nutrient uptake outer membrane protein [Bacteroides sp.]
MKKIYYPIFASVMLFLIAGCDLDRYPETTLADTNFWKSESDLKGACNRLYNLLAGFEIDTRADDLYNGNNDISSGNRTVPNESGNWTDPYYRIQTANIILEKSADMELSEEVLNRYHAEARFFRAYHYFDLVKKYGDVPLVLKAFQDINDPDIKMGRSPRADVLEQMYKDLDFAAEWLPVHDQLKSNEWGRVTRSSALALKARVGLYEGTRSKFHNYGTPETHLQIAVKAAEETMQEGHILYGNYESLFLYDGQGADNKENIFVKIYGKTSSGANIQTHNNSRDLENRYAPTRNLIDIYLCADGLPYGISPLVPTNESRYNEVLENRDPRLNMTVYSLGEEAYKGIFSQAYAFGRTAYIMKKGFIMEDWNHNSGAVVDKILIRYAEVLLTYAEARYELNGSISDADLERTINALRQRAGLTVKLTNDFVNRNQLDMREEIRRERTVELAGEGFRYDDLIRWKTAEEVLPRAIYGAKYIEEDWGSTSKETVQSLLNENDRLVMQLARDRRFDARRDYLYPVPLNEISLSGGNVTQNPYWSSNTEEE